MFSIFGTIAHILGSIIMVLYNFLWSNYGLAIIALTILIRFLLLPLAVKSFNSMAKVSEIQPLMNELQRKYKNDKEAYNREVMKLYQEKKVNPFGGCLPLLLQIPIIYGLFMVISKPLTYMLNYTPQQVQEMTKLIGNSQYSEVTYVKEHSLIDLHFLGINLGDIPHFMIPTNLEQGLLLLVPILTGITTYLSSKYSQIPTSKTAEAEKSDMQNYMQKQMLIMMPLMTAWFSFVVPAGLSLYWLVGNMFQMVQQKYLIKKFFEKKEV